MPTPPATLRSLEPCRSRDGSKPAGIRNLLASALSIAVLLTLGVRPARADEQTGLALSQNCAIVGASDATAILGVRVQTSDPSTQTGGICTFPSESITQEGVLTYSIVTTADVIARASYFRLLARRCGNVDPRAPRAAQCATFRKLADAATPAEYYADRSNTPEAVAHPGLGDGATETATAVYVLRGGEVFECVVRRSEFLDVDRSVALAALLLHRVPEVAAPPAPAASKAS